jgi:hypothetical protein
METWKMPLDGAKEHRLEAYAALFSGLSSDLSAQCSIGFQPVFCSHMLSDASWKRPNYRTLRAAYRTLPGAYSET